MCFCSFFVVRSVVDMDLRLFQMNMDIAERMSACYERRATVVGKSQQTRSVVRRVISTWCMAASFRRYAAAAAAAADGFHSAVSLMFVVVPAVRRPCPVRGLSFGRRVINNSRPSSSASGRGTTYDRICALGV